MATREEKLQIIEDLKVQIDVLKSEIKEKKRHHKNVGGLVRTGIVVFFVAVGLVIAAILLF